MRRIKIILAVVAAVATMMVLAAPAMAQVEQNFGDSSDFSPGFVTFGDSDLGNGVIGVGGVDDGFTVLGGPFDSGDLFGDGCNNITGNCSTQFVLPINSSVGGVFFD